MDMFDVFLAALDRWDEVGGKAIQDLIDSGEISSLSDVANIPDEQFEVLPSGELRIFVTCAGKTIDMRIAPTEWHWKE